MEVTVVMVVMVVMVVTASANPGARRPTPDMAATGAMRSRAPSAREMEERMLDIRLLTWSLALFAVVSFLVCVAYGLVAPEALHMHTFLETVMPGFRWLTVPGFFIGLVQSFLYGVYAGLVFGWIHNALARRWSAPR